MTSFYLQSNKKAKEKTQKKAHISMSNIFLFRYYPFVNHQVKSIDNIVHSSWIHPTPWYPESLNSFNCFIKFFYCCHLLFRDLWQSWLDLLACFGPLLCCRVKFFFSLKLFYSYFIVLLNILWHTKLVMVDSTKLMWNGPSETMHYKIHDTSIALLYSLLKCCVPGVVYLVYTKHVLCSADYNSTHQVVLQTSNVLSPCDFLKEQQPHPCSVW